MVFVFTAKIIFASARLLCPANAIFLSTPLTKQLPRGNSPNILTVICTCVHLSAARFANALTGEKLKKSNKTQRERRDLESMRKERGRTRRKKRRERLKRRGELPTFCHRVFEPVSCVALNGCWPRCTTFILHSPCSVKHRRGPARPRKANDVIGRSEAEGASVRRVCRQGEGREREEEASCVCPRG